MPGLAPCNFGSVNSIALSLSSLALSSLASAGLVTEEDNHQIASISKQHQCQGNYCSRVLGRGQDCNDPPRGPIGGRPPKEGTHVRRATVALAAVRGQAHANSNYLDIGAVC